MYIREHDVTFSTYKHAFMAPNKNIISALNIRYYTGNRWQATNFTLNLHITDLTILVSNFDVLSFNSVFPLL